jgi:hypothetical protein
MPIDTKTLGKYRLPKIYQVEIDQSIVELPIQDVLINLVPGFSKKGPVNRPVRVDSPAEFESIFGTIDKNLENKGSFFHRMVEDMLNTGPVWALNLLKTDPVRDTLEYESVSVSAQYANGSKTTAPYERFFNRQDFWERDTESFGDIVIENYTENPTMPNPEQNLFSITNIGTTRLTTFLYKSSVAGFDVSAEQWYGSADKVPLFINPKDLISDYIITVLAVAGDFTDYNALSVDPYWNKYFNINGLIKTELTNFINDDLVNRIAYYDCSLIPNFRDLNDLDMYIKDVVNASTDITGLFCWFNEDALLSTDFPKGNIDLIGQTLVGSTNTTIDFLSYFGSISESLSYSEKQLDNISNVFGNYAQRDMSVGYYTVTGRTAQYTNWYTNISPSGDTTGNVSGSYASNILNIHSGGTITLTGSTYSVEQDDIIYFSKTFGNVLYTTPYYVTYTNGAGLLTISEIKGGNTFIPVSGTTTNIFIYSLKQEFRDNVGSFSYVIGQTLYSGTTSLTDPMLYHEPLTISNSGTSYSRYDVVYLSSDYTKLHILKGNQVTGTSPTKPNYLLNNENTIILGWVLIQYNAVTGVNSPSITYTWVDGGVTVDSIGYKYYGTTGTNYVIATSGTTTSGNYLDLTFVGTKGSTDYTNYKQLRMKKIFTELYTNLLLNKSVMISQLTGIKTPVLNPVVYIPTVTSDGHIMIYFDTTVAPFEYFNISNGSFLFYYIDNEFVLDVTNSINTLQTLYTPLSNISPFVGIVSKWSNLYQDFYNGIINNGDYFFVNNTSGSTETKVYLKMYLDSNSDLVIKFVDGNISQWLTQYGSKLIIYSNKGDIKQTVEIENSSYIIDPTNVTSIYVDKTRYSEIKRGMYLEAYYDTTYYDDPTGEGYLLGMTPRKLVRIVDVKNDTVNTAYKILYTDGPIKVTNSETSPAFDYYTTSYNTIDNYFNEYIGITMKPFVVHVDSLPNGTDTRQQEILSVIDKTTNLAKGLANKNRISWRYMIDSFGLGLTANSKQQLVDLCGMKLNCLGFINMPSVRQLKTSLNPSFINQDRTLNTEYLSEGGNPDTNPSFLYSFAKKGLDVDGRSCVGYFFPYVKGSDDLTKFVPPAAKVAKAYMNKFLTTTGGIYPWTIVAGSILGALPDVKETEMRFTDDNLTDLMNMGANPLDFTQKRGFYINTENTAQVFPYSSLSVIHSREVLIELENRLYDMLLNYQWRFNTPEIRNEIKYRADQICKELWDANALYNFKNTMDKSNNTDYIIDLQMGVLDTYIEIIKGMGTIVNNITILKKGSIQSGGFVPSNKSI